MAHIGVQRFHAGNSQDQRPQGKKGDGLIFSEEGDSPFRVEGIKHFGIVNDAAHAQNAQREEPYQHHRRKKFADAAGAFLLDKKQQRQHHHREWDDEFLQRRGGDL